ncbi:hypothetical protein J4711_15050, partial [Staphylococcus epidermidis]|nr:hypothetical protein [Staphylococcus epidermidis]
NTLPIRSSACWLPVVIRFALGPHSRAGSRQSPDAAGQSLRWWVLQGGSTVTLHHGLACLGEGIQREGLWRGQAAGHADDAGTVGQFQDFADGGEFILAARSASFQVVIKQVSISTSPVPTGLVMCGLTPL